MEHYKLIIGGKLTEGQKALEVKNPYDQKPYATCAMASVEQIGKAIECATKGFAQTKKLKAYQRAAALAYVAAEISKNREDFGRTIASESGKPLKDALVEADRAISTFTFASEEAKCIGGEMLSLDATEASKEKFGFTKRFPIGPITCITPFNYPLNLVAHKLAPAMAAGNTFILKPASSTPITSLKLGYIIMKSGYPLDAINVIPCSSKDASAIVEDERIKMISFTGSADVGWGIKARAGKKKVALELGGNATVIIDESADLEKAAKRCANAAFRYSGQVCIRIQKISAHEKVYEKFKKLFLEGVASLKIGNPLEASTDFGPMIDQQNADRIEQWVQESVKGGAKIVVGGKKDATLYYPTVIENAKENDKISCMEAFGPVLVMEKFSDFKNAVAQVNKSVFGLQTGVFTNSMANMFYAYENLDVGGVIFNDTTAFRVDNMPYGGIKDSGFGREGLKYAIEEMTEPKLAVFHND